MIKISLIAKTSITHFVTDYDFYVMFYYLACKVAC